jgi:integrase
MGRDVGVAKPGAGIELRKGPRAESIRIIFYYRGMRCRESLRLSHTKKNIAYAVRLRGEILNAIERGTFRYSDSFPDSPNCLVFAATPTEPPAAAPTVGTLLREYLLVARRNLALSSANCYDDVAKVHLFPRWDTTPITDVTTRDLRLWIMSLKARRKTIQLILTPLRNTFEIALVDEIIESNPFDAIRLNKIIARDQLSSKFKADPFSIDEIEAILAACDRPQERNMFQLAFATGLRPSEYIALTWSAVSFDANRIWVEAAFVDGEAKDTAKTEAGLRHIDLRKGATCALRAQAVHTGKSGLVFLNPAYQERWAGDKPIYRRWIRILRNAGVRFRNPYQTRHTFASSLLMLGEVPLYVAAQMGHTDTTMITKTYGKWTRARLTDDRRARLLRIYGSEDSEQ